MSGSGFRALRCRVFLIWGLGFSVEGFRACGLGLKGFFFFKTHASKKRLLLFSIHDSQFHLVYLP